MNRSELDVIEAQLRAAAVAADHSRQDLRRLRVAVRKGGANFATLEQAWAVHRRNQAALTESRKRLATAMRLYKATK